MQAIQVSAFATRVGAWLRCSRTGVTTEEQEAVIWYVIAQAASISLGAPAELCMCTRTLRAVLLQPNRAAGLSKPTHQPAQARDAEAVAPCQKSAFGRHNSLSTVAPAVATYWDTAKNGVTPDQVMAGSTTRRHWLLPLCNYSWQAIVFGKVAKNSGCPKCSSTKKVWNKQPSLTNSKHPAMLEFGYERNQRAGFDPDKITAGSRKMVH